MSTLFRLNSIFQDVFDDPTLSVQPETSQQDLPEWDSVAQVKLVLAIEEDFSIRLSSDELSNIHTVGDFLSAIARQESLGA